ncbi:NYN domain-containing protein [Asticcacaulis taihuensis]|uniref:NYN domain-containing protein n=1 Tax=Asticcacaulis taihuensis TaxID=260084 RepID=UPI0026F051A5|nr:NYN domain-containing protein [Asticcacaulis taihuensis]
MSKGRETGSGGGWSLPFFRKRAAFYYDGFNLYHAVDAYKRPYLKWLNLKALGRAIAPKSEVVKRVVWCSAFSPTHRSKLQRHEDYMKALQGQGVICRMGHFIHAMDGCNSCGHKWQISVEKQGDVNLALSIAADAEDDLFDVCYLVTADGDHAATARYLKERFPKKRLVLVTPPGRYHNRHIERIADECVEIQTQHLEASLLPEMAKYKQRFLGRKEVVPRPELYDPPQVRVKSHLKLIVNNG